ncbi:Unknown protein [Striga hermonthica]|uniref:Transposase n=1 Tax=Striga hermonthica TaxID=68872 RepID=A0A9N7N3A5_STRHE|nr:Unknown protein [Striga hermonthica]
MIANEEGVKVEVGKTTRDECKYCESDLACNSTKNGTSTLQKHLELHCYSYPGSARNLREGQKHFVVDLEGKDVVVTHWTQENCTNAAVEMIVIDEMPFSAIEKNGFRIFCAVAVPKWKIPSRKVVVKSFLTYELKLAFDRLAEDEESKYKGYFDEDEYEEDDDDVSELVIGVEAEGAEGAEGEKRERKNKGKKRVGPPNEEDWYRAEAFIKFLKVFFDVTLNVSCTNTPTAHKAFSEIVTIKCEIDDLFDAPLTNQSTDYERTLFNMSVQMRRKYRKYFDTIDDVNKLLLVALVLDPRYKLRYFSRVLQNMLQHDSDYVKRKTEELKDLIVTLTDLYASMNGGQSSNTKRVLGDSEAGQKEGSIRCPSMKVTGRRAMMMEDWQKDLEDGNAIVIAYEVDRYLLDPIEKPKGDWDILNWWKLNGVKYPNLQALAKDVLAIQVSTVASEASFSTGKRVIDPHRSSLTPRSVEALICLQQWLKSDSISSLAYTPTPEEIEWLEKTEQELDQEERELKDKLEEKKDKESKTSKANKGFDVGKSSKNTLKNSVV